MLIETKISPMPTCADFGFIDQYLNLKEQMEITETYDLVDLDQKVPQTEYPASFPPKSAIKVEDSSGGLCDAYFEDLGRPYTMFSANHFTSTSTTPPLLSTQLPESIFSGSDSLTTLTSLNSSNSMNSSDHSNGSSTTDTVPCSFVARVAGSGCTVIQGSADPQLCDLDKPRTMLDDCIKKYIKTEPPEDMQLPQTCHMGTLATSGLGLHGNYESSMETVLDTLFRNDVQYDCKILAISPEPFVWNLDDVQRWVKWTCKKFNYKDDCWTLFNVPGEILCRMSEDDFRWRAPEAGNCLYHQLEAWKLACKSFPEPPVSSYPSPPYGESEHHYPPTSRFQGQPDPSVSPSPSVSSTCSTASCSSSSNSFHQTDTNDDDVFTHAAGNGIRRQSGPQIPFQPSAGNRAHSHPGGQRQPKQTIHLWQFLKELLEDPDSYHGCIKWTDRSRGIFKIEDSSKVARLWGRRKNRPAMNYDKLSRSVRQYYKKGIIKKTEHSKRLVYQFCPPYL